MGKGAYHGGSTIVGPKGLSSSDPADKRNSETIISINQIKGRPRPAKGETWEDIKHLLPEGFVAPVPKPKRLKSKKLKKASRS